MMMRAWQNFSIRTESVLNRVGMLPLHLFRHLGQQLLCFVVCVCGHVAFAFLFLLALESTVAVFCVCIDVYSRIKFFD